MDKSTILVLFTIKIESTTVCSTIVNEYTVSEGRRIAKALDRATLVTALAVLVTMLLALVRAFLGPTVYDRILAVNMFGTKVMLLIAVTGFLNGRPDWLDLALLYGLISFLGVWLERNLLVWPSVIKDDSTSYLGVYQILIALGFFGAYGLVFLFYTRVFPTIAIEKSD